MDSTSPSRPRIQEGTSLFTLFGANASSRRFIPLYLCSSDFAALLVLSWMFHELVPALVHTLDFRRSGDDDTFPNVTDRFRRATTVNLHQLPLVMYRTVHELARLEFLRTLNIAAGGQWVDIKIFSSFPHIEVIVVSGNRVSGDIAVFAGSKNLEKLNMRGCEYIQGDIAVFRFCPELKDLNLFNCKEIIGDIDVFKNTPALKELGISQTRVTGNIEVFQATPNMVNLDLRGSTKIKGNVEVFEHTPNLTELNLYWCKEIKGDISVFEFCPNATDVILVGTKVFGNVSVFENTPLMEKLDLEDCDKITGDISVFGFCPNVTEVTLSGTKVSGDTGVLANHKKLKVADFRNCYNIIKKQLPNCNIWF